MCDRTFLDEITIISYRKSLENYPRVIGDRNRTLAIANARKKRKEIF